MAKLNIQDYYKNQANNPYALNTDANYYKNMYDRATAAAQAVEERGIANAEAAWQRNLAGTQATALDTIRKNNASAIATGASKGMQAANELSAVLGLQDTAVEESTALAQQRLDLADAYAAEYAKNAVTAQETANANKQAMMNAAIQQYGYDATAEAQAASVESRNLLDYAQSLIDTGDSQNVSLANSIYQSLGLPYQYNKPTTEPTETDESKVPAIELATLLTDKGASNTSGIDIPVLSRNRVITFDNVMLPEIDKDGNVVKDADGNIKQSNQTVKYKALEKASDTVAAALRQQGMRPGQVMVYNNNLYMMGNGGAIRRLVENND